ncbi:MAG: DUF502 domain-containing protein [Opitutales bacterium]|jgi:uncharacterized membrane protein
MLRSIRTAFITGLLILLPLGVTVFIINIVLNRIGNPASELFFRFIDQNIRELPTVEIPLQILSLIIVFIIITILGYFSRIFIGQLFLKFFERILTQLPLISQVYNTVKQLVDTFSQQKKAVFQEVVMIEYPRKGIYAIGFLTNQAKGEVQAITGENLVNVFVPTTPNPTSGFLLMLPKEEVIPMQMSIADGMKTIISGGAVTPHFNHLDNDKESTKSLSGSNDTSANQSSPAQSE